MIVNKNIKNIIIIFMMIYSSFFSICITYAGNDALNKASNNCEYSTVCSVPPLGFQFMTNFIKDVLGSIKTVGTRDPYIGQYVSPNRFQGNEFIPPKESFTNKLMRNVWQKFNSMITFGIIFTDIQNMAGIVDFFSSFVVVFKNNIFLREYLTLTQLDGLINDKKYELGLGGGWFHKLNDQNRAMIQKIFDAYGPNGNKLFLQAKLGDSVSYAKIVTLMSLINNSMKRFISFGSTGVLKDIEKNNLYVTLYLNPEIIVSMEKEYSCVDKCNYKLNLFTKNISKISKDFVRDSKDVLKVFKDASKRFSIIFGFGTIQDKEALKKRQQDLLRSQFGVSKNSSSFWDFKNLSQMIQKTRKKISDGWESLVRDFGTNNGRIQMFSGAHLSREEIKKRGKKVMEEVLKIEKEYTKNKLDAFDETQAMIDLVKSWNQNPKVNFFYAKLEDNMNTVFAQASQDVKSAKISDNVYVTSLFTPMLDLMDTTIVDVIGNMNTNGIIKNLGDACKTQCANVGGKCFY